MAGCRHRSRTWPAGSRTSTRTSSAVPSVTEAMARAGALDSGVPIDYGLGQFVGTYRGVARIHHGGSWGGFKAALQRYPAEKTSVIVLCNRARGEPRGPRGSASPTRCSGRADAGGPADAAPASLSGDVASRRGLVLGRGRGDLLTFDAKGDTLTLVSGDRRTPLTPWGAGRFMADRPYKVLFSFASPGGGPATVERVIEERERGAYVRQVPGIRRARNWDGSRGPGGATSSTPSMSSAPWTDDSRAFRSRTRRSRSCPLSRVRSRGATPHPVLASARSLRSADGRRAARDDVRAAVSLRSTRVQSAIGRVTAGIAAGSVDPRHHPPPHALLVGAVLVAECPRRATALRRAPPARGRPC